MRVSTTTTRIHLKKLPTEASNYRKNKEELILLICQSKKQTFITQQYCPKRFQN